MAMVMIAAIRAQSGHVVVGLTRLPGFARAEP